ncbi:hypothetical protein [Natronobacterium gregoryi]|uniref:DUF8009 domain-containing protein n=2 Tax=Natronobacterium gregoryi TaxID=44930 RepID=L0AIU3_NATGS|nr:hypothetical protein [Natronobacterium gregoryi]AFZ73364.1 hypothetical protein Natgr_2186 [Natronobacterium gregoryi SP2]ELY68560.1 hypothetical protein C490_09083 [Natronobacterium gregoryi SP2]PLK19645.1 hypothetical protein CYV19_13560 [Natronobacterium gregoryi SP2]SFI73984.1 hypothetical protein SAMN05443661_104140 [Natronobacterium gregoryi]
MADDDPFAIRSIAVSTADAVDAYVYTQENPEEAVLRATPPFHGRMRARLHVYQVDDAHRTDAVHVPPEAVISDGVLATYPDLETVDEVDSERVGKRHADAVENWQERAKTALVDSTTLEIDGKTHEVEIKRLE